jgi:hypothetical protein
MKTAWKTWFAAGTVGALLAFGSGIGIALGAEGGEGGKVQFHFEEAEIRQVAALVGN